MVIIWDKSSIQRKYFINNDNDIYKRMVGRTLLKILFKVESEIPQIEFSAIKNNLATCSIRAFNEYICEIAIKLTSEVFGLEDLINDFLYSFISFHKYVYLKKDTLQLFILIPEFFDNFLDYITGIGDSVSRLNDAKKYLWDTRNFLYDFYIQKHANTILYILICRLDYIVGILRELVLIKVRQLFYINRFIKNISKKKKKKDKIKKKRKWQRNYWKFDLIKLRSKRRKLSLILLKLLKYKLGIRLKKPSNLKILFKYRKLLSLAKTKQLSKLFKSKKIYKYLYIFFFKKIFKKFKRVKSIKLMKKFIYLLRRRFILINILNWFKYNKIFYPLVKLKKRLLNKSRKLRKLIKKQIKNLWYDWKTFMVNNSYIINFIYQRLFGLLFIWILILIKLINRNIIKVVFTLWVSFLLFKSNKFAEGFYRYIFSYKNNYAFICDNILLANIHLVIPRYLNSFEGMKLFQLDSIRGENLTYLFKRKRNIAYVLLKEDKRQIGKKANINFKKGKHQIWKKTNINFRKGKHQIGKKTYENFKKGKHQIGKKAYENFKKGKHQIGKNSKISFI